MTEGRAPRLEIMRAEDQHAEALAEFIRQVWDSSATAESVLAARKLEAAANVAEPGVAPPTWIAIQQGRILGYVTTIPIRLWDGGQDWPAYWIKGLMVLPEFRGGPIGFLVLKAAAAALPLTGGLAVAAPARRLFEALGYRDLGPVPNWVRPLAPGRILERIDLAALGVSSLPNWVGSVADGLRRVGLARVGGWAGGVALRGGAAALRIGGATAATEVVGGAAIRSELDGVWQSARERYHSAVVRDGPYLWHRYGESRSEYLWLTARRRGVLVGLAILRRPRANLDPRLKGIRVATLADLLYRPDRPGDGLALLGAAERAAHGIQADAILASTSAPALRALLRRQFYLPLSGNVHFLFRDSGGGPRLGTALAEWWISRGDGQADEIF